MRNKTLHFGRFSISVTKGWDDITESLEVPGAPLTIADPISGVGGLQFTFGDYQGGRPPEFDRRDLAELLDDFSLNRGLSDPFDHCSYEGEIIIEGRSFHSDEDFVRVWYVTDGSSIMLVTYICTWEHREQEAFERETSVRSIRFQE